MKPTELIFILLGILFIGLKLTGKITWSWWYVTLPFWGGAAFVLSVMFFLLLIAGLVAITKK